MQGIMRKRAGKRLQWSKDVLACIEISQTRNVQKAVKTLTCCRLCRVASWLTKGYARIADEPLHSRKRNLALSRCTLDRGSRVKRQQLRKTATTRRQTLVVSENRGDNSFSPKQMTKCWFPLHLMAKAFHNWPNKTNKIFNVAIEQRVAMIVCASSHRDRHATWTPKDDRDK